MSIEKYFMKKNYLLIGAFILTLCVIGVLLYFTYNKPEVSPPPAPTGDALVTPLQREVFSSSPITELTSPTRVAEGTRLMTSPTGRALIEGRHVAVLDANTEITITTHDAVRNKTALELHTGNLWNRVQKLSDQGEYYTVDTQNARASVRGTSFGLTKIDRMTILIVMEGSVLFGPTNGPFELVTAGKKAIVIDNDPAIITSITEQDWNDPWFMFNNPWFTSTTQEVVSSTLPHSVSGSAQPQLPSTLTNVDTVTKSDAPIENATNTNGEDKTTGENSQTTSTPATPVAEPQTPPTPQTPTVILTSVSPEQLTYGTSATAILRGEHFVTGNATTLLIGTVGIKTFTKIDDTHIQFTLDTRLVGVGTHNVTLTGANGTSSLLPRSITIVSPTPSPTTTTVRGR